MDGILTQELDRSAEMAELRKMLMEEEAQDDPFGKKRFLGDEDVPF